MALSLSLFRTALAIEILTNVSSLPFLLLNPDTALAFLVEAPSQVTPATRTLTQFFGGMVSALTVPLILSWADPKPGAAGEVQRGVRRYSYTILGAVEVCLSATMAVQYLQGNSGFSPNALLICAANMGALAGLRAFFVVGRPDLLAGQDETNMKAE